MTEGGGWWFPAAIASCPPHRALLSPLHTPARSHREYGALTQRPAGAVVRCAAGDPPDG